MNSLVCQLLMVALAAVLCSSMVFGNPDVSLQKKSRSELQVRQEFYRVFLFSNLFLSSNRK